MMNHREKTALFVTCLHVFFTLLKFLAFRLTGSISVLAEAWHSFADIATSALVLFSMQRWFRSKKEENTSQHGSILEQIVAVGIGVFLLAVSLGILFTVVRSRPTDLRFPVTSGLCFLFFSLCSYGVYRYESSIGKRTGSVGLVADSMHAKSDTYASFFTGLVLVLYAVGINLDRLGAFLISLLILTTAIETIVNSVLYRKEKLHDRESLYTIWSILGTVFQPPVWRKLAQASWTYLHLGQSARRIGRRLAKGVLAVVVLMVAIWMARLFVFTIGPSQQGIVERFGKPLGQGEPYAPGIHFKWPWPIDHVVKIDTKNVRSLTIGAVSVQDGIALLWTRAHGFEEPFLSADNSFFYPYVVVEYNVKDAFLFTYRHTRIEALLPEIANRILSAISAQKPFYAIATSYRGPLEKRIQKELQQELDRLECGVGILGVCLKDIHPPIPIAPAFEDVIAAYQHRETVINLAHAYRNDSLPSARADAAMVVAEAQGYRARKMEHASGDVQRVLANLDAYKVNPSVARKRMKLDAIQEALADISKVLVDPLAGTPGLWVGFGNYIEPLEASSPDEEEQSKWESQPADDYYNAGALYDLEVLR